MGEMRPHLGSVPHRSQPGCISVSQPSAGQVSRPTTPTGHWPAPRHCCDSLSLSHATARGGAGAPGTQSVELPHGHTSGKRSGQCASAPARGHFARPRGAEPPAGPALGPALSSPRHPRLSAHPFCSDASADAVPRSGPRARLSFLHQGRAMSRLASRALPFALCHRLLSALRLLSPRSPLDRLGLALSLPLTDVSPGAPSPPTLTPCPPDPAGLSALPATL